MDLVMTTPAAGGLLDRNQEVGGDMVDLTTIGVALGGGLITAWGILVSKKDKAHELVLSRLSTLEHRMDEALEKIAELQSDKLRLEAEKYQLQNQVAEMTLERERYQRNEQEFRLIISDLETRLASKTADLRSVSERLEAIKSAMERQNSKSAVLYQKNAAGTEVTITTEKSGEIL